MQTELVSKNKLLSDIWQFEFIRPQNFEFTAGDFCEVEIGDTQVGASRWLTIASSPNYKYLSFITKIPDANPSHFKNLLGKLTPGDSIMLSPALGMFHLPRQIDAKMLMIALGIGVTPYISMISATKVSPMLQNVKMLYWAKDGEHLSFDKLNQVDVMRVKTSEFEISTDSIAQLCRDFKQRTIYLSGPENICLELYEQLQKDGLELGKIKLDYFEGYDSI